MVQRKGMQMEFGSFPELRRGNQFLGRNRQLEFSREKIPGKCKVQSKSLAKTASVNECEETTQSLESTNQKVEGNQFPKFAQTKNSSLHKSLNEKFHHSQGSKGSTSVE